jgi:hypothetical protein
MATAVSSSTKTATATAMLVARVAARISRLTISKPRALCNPGSPHLQSTVSLSRVEPPSPSSFPPRLSFNHDRHPYGDKNTHTQLESQEVKADGRAQKLSSLSNPMGISAKTTPGRFLPLGFPDSSVVVLCGGWWALVSDPHTKTWAKRREKEAPSWWERRHGGFDLARAFSTRSFLPYSALIFWLLLFLF